MRLAFAFLAALALAGCTAALLDGPEPAPSEGEPPYRDIVAKNLGRPVKAAALIPTSPKIFKDGQALGAIEISGLRRVHHTSGWTWLTCLKVDAGRDPRVYAIFIRNNMIVDSRSNVAADRCAEQTYYRFDDGGSQWQPQASALEPIH